MAEEVIKPIIEINPGDSIKTLKKLRDETKAYQEALLNMEKGSEEYVKVAKQISANQKEISSVMSASKKYTDDAEGSYDALVATMKRLKEEWRATADEAERAQLGERIKEINDQLKDMDASVGNFQRNVGNYASAFDGLGEISKIGKDATEGFEGLSKVIALSSKEMAAFTNAINKAKAAFKITESMSKVSKGMRDISKAEEGVTVATKSATVATKAFGVALKSVGIAAIVALLAAFAINLDGIKKRLGPLGDKFKDLWENKIKPVIGAITGGIVGVGTVFAEVIGHIYEIGKGFIDILKRDWEAFFNWVGKMWDTVKNAYNVYKLPGGLVAAGAVFAAGMKEANKEFTREAEDVTKIWNGVWKNIDIKGAFNEGYKAGKEFIKGLGKGAKEEKGGTGEIKIPVKIDWSKLSSDEFDKKIDEILNGDAKTKLAQRLAEIYKEDFAQQLIDLEAEREQVLAVFEGTEEQKLALIAHYGEEEEKLRAQINEKISADFNKEVDARVKKQQEEIAAAKKLDKQRIQGYEAVGESLGNLADLFEQDTIAYKALAISQALISTFLAGSKVMAEEMGPAWVKIAAMAAVITAGLANVASIISVNPSGENGASASAPQTAAAVPVIGNSPNVNYTRNLTTAEEEDKLNQPMYVSVTDINNMQNKVEVVDANSTF